MRAALALLLAACHAPPPDAIAQHTAPAAGACIHGDHGYRLARVRGDIVLCSPTECFTVLEGGQLGARPLDRIPAVAYEDGDHRVAVNPDGKRAAMIATQWSEGLNTTIVDLSTRKTLGNFYVDIPGQFWFIGNTVYVASAPAGPGSALMAYTFDGKYTMVPGGMYHGEVALTDPQHLVFEDNGLRGLYYLDGIHEPARGPERAIPKGPCEANEDGDEWTDATGECGTYLGKYYVPYDRSQVIADGDGYMGYAQPQLFMLDRALNERGRVSLPICPGTMPKAPVQSPE